VRDAGAKEGARDEKKKVPWLPLAIGVGAVVLVGIMVANRNREAGRAAAPRQETPVAMPAVSPTPQSTPAVQVPVEQTRVTSAEIPKADALTEHFGAKDVPDKLTLSDVTFDFATANLHSGKATIDEVAALMKEHPSSSVRIEGHTDAVGNENANQKLSLDRANAVKTMLVGEGIDASRIEAVGLGEKAPVDSNASDEGRAKNRRIDAVIIKR
jgi:outer membrane protein OmpA-like peptidoglycan-associated protein